MSRNVINEERDKSNYTEKKKKRENNRKRPENPGPENRR